MSASLQRVGAITLFVEDPSRSKSFYENVFDLSVIYEDEDSAVFRFENALVNLLRISAARSLIDPGAVAAERLDRASSSASGGMTRMRRARSWQHVAWSC